MIVVPSQQASNRTDRAHSLTQQAIRRFGR